MLGVLSAVDLDDQPQLHTAELRDERANRILAAKLHSQESPIAKTTRKQRLRVAPIASKLTRTAAMGVNHNVPSP
jgi:hypothetical protein